MHPILTCKIKGGSSVFIAELGLSLRDQERIAAKAFMAAELLKRYPGYFSQTGSFASKALRNGHWERVPKDISLKPVPKEEAPVKEVASNRSMAGSTKVKRKRRSKKNQES